MPFIAKNPIVAPKVQNTVEVPPSGTRGLYPTDSGWYDIDENGNITKLETGDLDEYRNYVENTYATKQEVSDNYATKEEFGSINTALEGILEIQNSLIGGDDE